MPDKRQACRIAAVSILPLIIGLLFCSVTAFAQGLPAQSPGSDALVIYSQNSGETITVEKYGEILQEKGYQRNRSFDLTIVDDRDDSEIRLIEGRVGDEIIQGKIMRKDYSMELSVQSTGKKTKKLVTASTELRGERLEIDYSTEKSDGGASKQSASLVAYNTPNKVKIISEEDSDKTAFYLLFSLPKIKIFGNNRGAPVEYIISIKEERTWLTTCDLIIGSINLVLTGYFIL